MPTSTAFSTWPWQLPGALWPLVVVMTIIALPNPQHVHTRALQHVGIATVLLVGFYVTYPIWNRGIIAHLYPLGGTVAAMTLSYLARRIVNDSHLRGIIFWATLFACWPALPQLNIASTMVTLSFAICVSTAGIGWWRGNPFFTHGYHIIPTSLLSWLLVNAQLRFDWYSAEAAGSILLRAISDATAAQYGWLWKMNTARWHSQLPCHRRRYYYFGTAASLTTYDKDDNTTETNTYDYSTLDLNHGRTSRHHLDW